MRDAKESLMAYFKALFKEFGPQGWWPGRTRFEIIVGAILTQNTAWANVEKAIRGLKKARLLTPGGLNGVKTERLAEIIRPAGYFNVKARRLKNFLAFLFDGYAGSIDRLFRKDGREGLREAVLGVNGIGPETADSILLYAAGRPEFVVDAYTKRVFARHGLCRTDAGYEEIKGLFMENLPPDVKLFNEYHALIVRVGKEFCRPRRPLCTGCPLNVFLDKVRP